MSINQISGGQGNHHHNHQQQNNSNNNNTADPAFQQRLLEQSNGVIRQEGYLMKKAIDSDNLREALKHASSLICELRRPELSPRSYYQLYLLASEHLQTLGAFVADRARHGRKLLDLYESVQHAGNILPRLYLLITVGAELIKAGEAADAAEILRDLCEMTRGVQHPVRGLFVRYYLSSVLKDTLSHVADLDTAVHVVLNNLTESCKLWIRIATAGATAAGGARVRREKERHDLRILVGQNVVRLSQIEKLNSEYFRSQLLPVLLDLVVNNFVDNLAQQYMLDVLVHVFADEFSDKTTLETLLLGCSRTLSSVDLRPVLVNLMKRLKTANERLGETAAESQATNTSENFRIIGMHLEKIVLKAFTSSAGGAFASEQSSAVAAVLEDTPTVAVGLTSIVDLTDHVAQLLDLLHAFLEFGISNDQGFPTTDFEFRVGVVYKLALSLLSGFIENKGDLKELVTEREDALDQLFVTACTAQGGVHNLQALARIPEVHSLHSLYPDQDTRQRLAKKLVDSLVESHTLISDSDTFNRISPLIAPVVAAKTFHADNLGRLVHSLHVPDCTAMNLLQTFRLFFNSASAEVTTTVLPGVIGRALNIAYAAGPALAAENTEEIKNLKKLFHFVHKTISALVPMDASLALNLWCDGAAAAASLGFDAIASEFFTQGLITFEEEVVSQDQAGALRFLIECALALKASISDEDYSGFTVRLVQYSVRLLKKELQVRLVLDCASLFVVSSGSAMLPTRKSLECLQKALKITVGLENPEILCDVLDKYIAFFEAGEGDVVTAEFVNNLITLVRENASGNAEAENRLRLTMDFVSRRKSEDSFSFKYRTVTL